MVPLFIQPHMIWSTFRCNVFCRVASASCCEKKKLQFEETCSIVIIGLTSQWKGPNWIRGPVVALCSLAHPTEVAGCTRTPERSTLYCRLGESATPEWPRWPRRPSKNSWGSCSFARSDNLLKRFLSFWFVATVYFIRACWSLNWLPLMLLLSDVWILSWLDYVSWKRTYRKISFLSKCNINILYIRFIIHLLIALHLILRSYDISMSFK